MRFVRVLLLTEKAPMLHDQLVNCQIQTITRIAANTPIKHRHKSLCVDSKEGSEGIDH